MLRERHTFNFSTGANYAKPQPWHVAPRASGTSYRLTNLCAHKHRNAILNETFHVIKRFCVLRGIGLGGGGEGL